MKTLWVILVPTIHSHNNKPIHVRYHKVWDKKVRDITGGLTILHPAKGQWVSPDGVLFTERMIPVQIMCTTDDIEKIADMTAAYYDQLAIMYYMVSPTVHVKHYDQTL